MDAYIYTLIEKKKMQELLESLHVCLELPVQLLDENGAILAHYGKQSLYCKHFTSHLSSRGTCAEIHATAGKRAMSLGSS